MPRGRENELGYKPEASPNISNYSVRYNFKANYFSLQQNSKYLRSIYMHNHTKSGFMS